MIDRPITDVQEANRVLLDLYGAAARGECHVARGRVRLPMILPGFALNIHEVRPQYRAKSARDEQSTDDLTQMGKTWLFKASFLRMLADTAGLRLIGAKRHDDGADPHLRDMSVELEGYDLLLRRTRWVGRYELDLRDGSARARVASPSDLSSKRKHIQQQAATGAFSRAVIDVLALPRGFKRRPDALLPIYIPTMDVHVASAPPEMMAQLSAAAIAQVFGFQPSAVPAALPSPAALPTPALPPPSQAAVVVRGPDPLDDLSNDEVPFDDPYGEPETEPKVGASSTQSTARPVTEEEKAQLEQLGCWKRGPLLQCGWSGEGTVTEQVYREAMKRFGGAP